LRSALALSMTAECRTALAWSCGDKLAGAGRVSAVTFNPAIILVASLTLLDCGAALAFAGRDELEGTDGPGADVS